MYQRFYSTLQLVKELVRFHQRVWGKPQQTSKILNLGNQRFQDKFINNTKLAFSAEFREGDFKVLIQDRDSVSMGKCLYWYYKLSPTKLISNSKTMNGPEPRKARQTGKIYLDDA